MPAFTVSGVVPSRSWAHEPHHTLGIAFLRENQQLRLLSARQALLARDPTRFSTDLETARSWMTRYYDTRARSTTMALASLKQLSANSINVELPTIAESLAAVRNFKVSRDKAVR